MALKGLFGGTFNPIHKAHIYMGKAVKEKMNLDKVIYIPAGNPPHKLAEDTSAQNRLNMVNLAVNDIDFFEVSDYEIFKKTYSYSVETVAHFKNIYPKDEFVFIIGEDSLNSIDTWYKPDVLLSLCKFAVVGRGGFYSNMPKQIEKLKKDYGADITYVKTGEINVSSSMIREKIQRNEDVSEFLDEKVLKYITDNALYK